MKHFRIKEYRWAIFLFVLSLATVGAWRFNCAPYADDFMYSHEYLVDEMTYESENYLGSPIDTPRELFGSMWRHYLTNNGRLANILAFAVTSLDPVPRELLNILVLALFPFLVIVAGGGRRALRNPMLIATVLVVDWWVYPWKDGMQATDFLLNYPWSAVMSLATILLYRRLGGMGRTGVVVTAIAAFLSAWMHEGFGIPLLVYLSADFILTPGKFRNRKSLTVLICALLGILVSISKGTLGRIGSREEHEVVLTIFLGYRMPLWFLALSLLVMAKRRLRSQVNIRRVLAPLSAVVCSSLMVVVLSPSERAMWPDVMYSMVGMVYLLTDVRYSETRLPGWVSGIATWSMVGVYLLIAWQLVYWQRKVSGDFYATFPEICRATDNIVYQDMTVDSNSLPWWVFSIPVTERYNEYVNMYFENMAAGHRGLPIILPEKYQGIPISKWEKIPGDNPFYRATSALVSTENLGRGMISVEVGEPTVAMNPLNRMAITLMSKKSRKFDVEFVTYQGPVFDGDTLYIHFAKPLRRFGFGREIVGIDLKH